MKRWMTLAALLLALLLLAACGVQQTLHDVAEELRTDRAEEPASASEAFPANDAEPVEEEPEDEPVEPEPASETDLPAPEPLPEEVVETDFAALPAEDCVAEREDVPNGRLPIVTLDCAGARDINDDIDGRVGFLIGADYCRLNYECYKSAEGRYLCLLLSERYDGDFVSYTPYVLDVIDGEWISGGALLSRLGVSEGELAEEELIILGDEFEHNYGDGREYGSDADFVQEQFERTTAAENADTDRVWLGDGGRLMFVGRIFGLAGAEFYEYPLATGYAYP